MNSVWWFCHFMSCRSYAVFAGWFITILTCLSAVLMQASRNGNDMWLSYWVDTSGRNQKPYSTTFYLVTSQLLKLCRPSPSQFVSPALLSFIGKFNYSCKTSLKMEEYWRALSLRDISSSSMHLLLSTEEKISFQIPRHGDFLENSIDVAGYTLSLLSGKFLANFS